MRRASKIYFDTEFTGLHKDASLISIGMISDCGTTFYAELTDYDKDQLDDWLKENVIDNLLFNDVQDCVRIEPIFFSAKSFECKCNKKTLRGFLHEWLDQFDGDIQFVSDVCHYDMVLLIDLLSDNALNLPKKINPVCHDICHDIAKYVPCSMKDAFNASREDILKDFDKSVKGEKHNALYDAKVIKEIHELIIHGDYRK